MKALFRGALVYDNGIMKKQDVVFDGVCLSAFDGDVTPFSSSAIFDNIAVFPGFCDVHVHFREPGFSYKETMESGSSAAAHGGYTAVLTMPNLKPSPDSIEGAREQLAAIRRGASIAVIPYGTITKGSLGDELSDMEAIAPMVAAFSDDGRGVQSEEMMLAAMHKAKSLGKMIVAHCEDNSLLRGGYIHDGEYARAHGHRGICSESEWGPIARDVELLKRSGAAYHVCHVSTKESVEIIRQAKAAGVDITCETAPHYLTLDDSCLQEDGRFKMNPPLRAREDREALVAGLLDGTVDMIATDHAPHSHEEKSRGLEGSMMGVVGLETAFPVIYTELVKPGIITLEQAVELLSTRPRARFGIDSDVGFTVFDLGCEYTVDPEKFLSKGRSTPYKGARVFGKCLATVYSGRAVYLNEDLIKI